MYAIQENTREVGHKTITTYKREHYQFADGSTLDRDEVTVEQFGKTPDGRTVWADADDDSCWYTHESGYLWRYDGEVL